MVARSPSEGVKHMGPGGILELYTNEPAGEVREEGVRGWEQGGGWRGACWLGWQCMPAAGVAFTCSRCGYALLGLFTSRTAASLDCQVLFHHLP